MVLDKHAGSGWSVRPWEKIDYPIVDRIFRQCLKKFPWRGSEAQEVKRLRQTLIAADVFVAEEPRAGVIGFLSLEPINAYVPHLFVDEDCLNEQAISFYRRLGWGIAAPADRGSGVVRRGQIRLINS